MVRKSRLTLAALLYFLYQAASFALFPYTDTIYFFQFSCLMLFTFVVSSACNTTTRNYFLHGFIAFAVFSSIIGCFQFFSVSFLKIPANKFESKITLYFMLTKTALQELRMLKIPAPVIERVQPLQDKRFETEEAFARAIRQQIGANQPQQYVLILLKKARVTFGNRIFTTIGHPTMLGGFYVFILPMIAAFTMKNLRERRRGWAGCYAGVLVLTLISLAMTQARGAWIACACSFGFFGLFAAKTPLFAWRAAHARSAFALFALLLTMMVGGGFFMLTRTNIADATSLNIRAYYYQVILRMIREHPIFGRGIGTFSVYYPRYRDSRVSVRLGEPAFNYWVAHAHNEHLEILSDGGIVAYGLFLWVIVETFAAFFRRKTLIDIGMAAALFGLLIDAFFSQNLRFVVIASLFWLLIGCSDLTPIHAERVPSSPKKFRMARVIGIGVVVMLAAFSLRFAYRLVYAEYYMKGGINLISVMLPQSAITWLLKAVHYHPHDKLLLYSLASSYKQIGQHDHAMTYFNKLQQLDPDFLLTQYQIGEIYLQQQQIEMARIHFEQQLKSNNMCWAIYEILANMELNEGHPQQAISYLNEIIAIEAVNDLQEVDPVSFARIQATLSRLKFGKGY